MDGGVRKGTFDSILYSPNRNVFTINLPILVFHRFLDYTRINHYTVSQTLLTTCTLRHAARAHGDGRTAGWPAAGILNLLSLQLLNSMNRRMAMPLMINHAFAICLSSQKRQ